MGAARPRPGEPTRDRGQPRFSCPPHHGRFQEDDGRELARARPRMLGPGQSGRRRRARRGARAAEQKAAPRRSAPARRRAPRQAAPPRRPERRFAPPEAREDEPPSKARAPPPRQVVAAEDVAVGARAATKAGKSAAAGMRALPRKVKPRKTAKASKASEVTAAIAGAAAGAVAGVAAGVAPCARRRNVGNGKPGQNTPDGRHTSSRGSAGSSARGAAPDDRDDVGRAGGIPRPRRGRGGRRRVRGEPG